MFGIVLGVFLLRGGRGRFRRLAADPGLMQKISQKIFGRAAAVDEFPIRLMQQGVSADGEIQVLSFRLHGARDLGSDNAEKISIFVVNRAAAVSRADGRRNLDRKS